MGGVFSQKLQKTTALSVVTSEAEKTIIVFMPEDDKPLPQTPPAKPFYLRAWESLGFLDGKLGAVTEGTANVLAGDAGKAETATGATVKQVVPWAAGLVAGLGTLTLAEPITRGAQTMTNGLSSMLRKVPLIGSPMAWVVDRVGDASGFVVSGLAALVTFRLLQPKGKTFDDFVKSAEIQETPNSGSGATPQPAERRDMSVQRPEDSTPDVRESVPVAPARVTQPTIPEDVMSASAQAEAQQLTYAQLSERRVRAMESDRQQLQEAYRALMQAENQRFENRVQFVKEAREFEKDPRTRMVQSLFQHAGLQQAEAEALVVHAPKLRATVYPGASETQDHSGGNGISKDGNIPQPLMDFAHKFENTYGKGFILVATTDGSGVKTTLPVGHDDGNIGAIKKNLPFDEMSTTQKVEYIEKAVAFAEARHEYIEKTCKRVSGGVTVAPSHAGMAHAQSYVPSVSYNYRDTSKVSLWTWLVTDVQKLDELGDHRGNEFPSGWLSLENEHRFLRELNGDIRTTEHVGFRDVSSTTYGTGLKDLGSGFGGFQQILDSYKETLKQAETAHNGEIKIYKDRVQFMEQSLGMLQKNGVAMISLSKENGMDALILRDVRAFDPTRQNHADTREMKWIGTLKDNQFVVREVKIGDRTVDLGKYHVVSLNSGAGMDDALKALDEKLAVMEVAAAQSGGVRLQTQNVESASATPADSPTVTRPDMARLAAAGATQVA